jgi:hypothetical protein
MDAPVGMRDGKRKQTNFTALATRRRQKYSKSSDRLINRKIFDPQNNPDRFACEVPSNMHPNCISSIFKFVDFCTLEKNC